MTGVFILFAFTMSLGISYFEKKLSNLEDESTENDKSEDDAIGVHDLNRLP